MSSVIRSIVRPLKTLHSKRLQRLPNQDSSADVQLEAGNRHKAFVTMKPLVKQYRPQTQRVRISRQSWTYSKCKSHQTIRVYQSGYPKPEFGEDDPLDSNEASAEDTELSMSQLDWVKFKFCFVVLIGIITGTELSLNTTWKSEDSNGNYQAGEPVQTDAPSSDVQREQDIFGHVISVTR